MIMSARSFALSDHAAARFLRKTRHGLRTVSLPAPRLLTRPALCLFVTLRDGYYTARRLLVCEPLLKACCRRYGRGVHAGVYVPYVQGRGAIDLGDGVHIDGQFAVSFAARFRDCPTLRIGDHTHVGHDIALVVADEVTIGSHCLIAAEVKIFDSPGHPLAPDRRLARRPPDADQIRPVRIGNNVWIGTRVMILPGVTVGDGSVIGAGSIVTRDIPSGVLAVGNPARVVSSLDAIGGGQGDIPTGTP